MTRINMTVDGVSYSDEVEPRTLLVQYLRESQAFHECHALQCGYCTPGMIMQACDVLKNNPDPSEQEIREGLEGNLCRCTGYHNIVKAVQQAAGTMSGAGSQAVSS